MHAPPVSLHNTSACATVWQHIFIPQFLLTMYCLCILLSAGQWQFHAMYVHESKKEHCLLQTYFPQKNVPMYAKKELQEQVFLLSGNLCCHEHWGFFKIFSVIYFLW